MLKIIFKKKLFLLWFISITIVALSCNKSEPSSSPSQPTVKNPQDTLSVQTPVTPIDSSKISNGLFGKWEFIMYYVSPGTAWHWENAVNGAILTINEDSTYTLKGPVANSKFPFWGVFGSNHSGKLANNYVDNSDIPYKGYLTIPETKDTLRIFYNRIINKSDSLKISLNCVEGCSYLFKKVG